MNKDWLLIVVASHYRWPEAPPYWDTPGMDRSFTRYPLVKIDRERRMAWYGAVLV